MPVYFFSLKSPGTLGQREKSAKAFFFFSPSMSLKWESWSGPFPRGHRWSLNDFCGFHVCLIENEKALWLCENIHTWHRWGAHIVHSVCTPDWKDRFRHLSRSRRQIQSPFYKWTSFALTYFTLARLHVGLIYDVCCHFFIPPIKRERAREMGVGRWGSYRKEWKDSTLSTAQCTQTQHFPQEA